MLTIPARNYGLVLSWEAGLLLSGSSARTNVGLNLLRVGYLAENFTLNMSWTQPEKGILAYQR